MNDDRTAAKPLPRGTTFINVSLVSHLDVEMDFAISRSIERRIHY